MLRIFLLWSKPNRMLWPILFLMLAYSFESAAEMPTDEVCEADGGTAICQPAELSDWKLKLCNNGFSPSYFSVYVCEIWYEGTVYSQPSGAVCVNTHPNPFTEENLTSKAEALREKNGNCPLPATKHDWLAPGESFSVGACDTRGPIYKYGIEVRNNRSIDSPYNRNRWGECADDDVAGIDAFRASRTRNFYCPEHYNLRQAPSGTGGQCWRKHSCLDNASKNTSRETGAL